MRPSRWSLPVLSALLAASIAHPAQAAFHIMQIEQVIGGVNGDVSAQAIQLRMRAAGQNIMSASRIRAWDAAGLNPVLIIDMASNVPNGLLGDRVLIVSPSFQGYVSPVQPPDFTMTNPIPASYLAAGSLTFEADGGIIYWRLSWGGAGYTGSGSVNVTNDADGNANPPFAGPLPHTSLQALQFTGPANAPSTNNAADYAVTAGASIWTNNARANETLVGLPGCSIYPGIDLFSTPSGGTTFQDYGGNPIPANFFDPGSDPFDGAVVLGGDPLPLPLDPADTIVERMAPAFLPGPGDTDVIPIEIVALSLRSVSPITVTYNGGQNPELWDVQVCLSSAAPQPQGTMTVRNGPCGCSEGGTFISDLPVLPKLTFTRTLPSPAVRVLDFGAVLAPPIQFQTLHGHWLPSDPGFSVVTAPAGLSVDHDCDGGTPPVQNLPPTTNFFPGLRAEHCQDGNCPSPLLVMKRLTVEQAALAAHGILPPQPCAGDADADQICDDADNCPNRFNPLQQDADDDGIGDDCDNCVADHNPCQEDGNGNGIGDACDVTAVGDPPVADGVRLSAPSPNPVTGALHYSVSLANAAHVRVEVYSVGGRIARTLVDRVMPAGRHDLTWDVRRDGAGLGSGVYYLRLTADGVQRSRTFTMIR